MPGFQELLVIVVVIVLVFGPDRLPELARTAARTIARMRNEAQRNIRELREVAEIDELERELREVTRDVRNVVEPGTGRPSGLHRPQGAPPAARGDGPPPTDPEAT